MALVLNSSNRKSKEKITDCCDFEQICNEKLDAFIEKIKTDKRYCYPITKDIEEDYPECATWAFTSKGLFLYERFKNRLYKVGLKHFGKEEMFFIDIEAFCIIDE